MRGNYFERHWRRYFVFGCQTKLADCGSIVLMADISDGENDTVATMTYEHAQTVIAQRDQLVDTLCRMAAAFESSDPTRFEAFMTAEQLAR